MTTREEVKHAIAKWPLSRDGCIGRTRIVKLQHLHVTGFEELVAFLPKVRLAVKQIGSTPYFMPRFNDRLAVFDKPIVSYIAKQKWVLGETGRAFEAPDTRFVNDHMNQLHITDDSARARAKVELLINEN